MTATILLVEDDLLVRMGIELVLNAQGYKVSACESGESALELVAAAVPSLVLMDVNLAGVMNGIEAAQRISSSHQLPIIFLTAQGDPLTKRRILAVQPRGILSKPFTPRQLTEAVNEVLPNGNTA